RESGASFGGGMCPSIVGRNHLDVLDGAATIAVVVLDSNIGQVDVPVVARQLVFPSPACDDLVLTFGDSAAVATTTTVLLQKPLILRLQFLLQHHAADARAAAGQLLGGSNVRGMDPRIVCQLTWLAHARVEPLLRLAGIGPAPTFQDCTTAL